MWRHFTEHSTQVPILDMNLFRQLFSELQNILNTPPCYLLLLKICFYFQFMCTCISLCVHVHICVDALGGEKCAESPGAGAYSWLWTTQHVCCWLNSGPLQDQQAFLTSESATLPFSIVIFIKYMKTLKLYEKILIA